MSLDEPTGMTDRVFGDRYRIVGLIGAGRVTEVFVADDLLEARRVALKVFDQSIGEDPDFADRVIEAVQHASDVEHPNIARVLDWGIDGVRLWVVSELCAGGSLRTMLLFGSRLTPSQALVMSLELARGLAHAHSQGLAHRGLKPENVLFSSDQRLRISDFGLSEVIADAPLARPSEAVDQVRYLSPEQAAGDPVSTPSDLYSLALVANEAVSGEAPAVGDTAVATMAARAETSAELSPDLVGLRGPLDRAGRLDPDERPEADELTIALLAAAETMSRPGPLPLVGIPGFDDVETPTVDLVAEASTAADPSNEVEVEVPGVELETLDGNPDEYDVLDPSVDLGGDLALVPDTPERVALEDLELAEPTFADAEIEEPVLDVPTAAAPARSTGVFRPDDDDLDDRLPFWPLLVLGLLVAGGVAAVLLLTNLGSGDPSVPDLLGADADTARAAVEAEGWEFERLETRLDGSDEGEVVAQRPDAGTELASGETVAVTVSLGPQMVEIPDDLPGLSLEQAQNRLEVEGLLVGTVTEEHNENLDAGLVIGIDEPTRQKPRGEAVALRVSIGAEDRTVPDTIIGTSINDATALLVGLRLQAVEEQVYDPEAEPGTVLGSVPPPGQIVPADSQVTLLVSAGPEPVEMPDLADLALAEAVDAIEELGLIFADTEGTPGEPVIATIPPAGEIVDVGTEVTIVLDEPSEDDEDPDATDEE